MNYFGLCKKNTLLLAFFSLEDAASRYCLEAIGWDLPEWDSGLMDKEAWMASARMRTRCTRSTVLGMESTFSGIQSTFFREAILRKCTFFEVWSWCGRLSVFSRSSLGGFRQGIRNKKETAILTNSTFCVLEFLFFLFYVLRLFLRVGTPRAQYSECVPSHSFTLVFYTEVTK